MNDYQERKQAKLDEKARAARRAHLRRVGKQLSILVIVLAALAAGVFGLVSFGGTNSAPTALLADVVAPSDWALGNRDASVVLIEYSDFQCPACASYEPFVRRLANEFGDQVGIVYRHFPLSQIHPNAELAARAAEAAGLQGKFWEIHDALFANQREWAESQDVETLISGYAADIGLDPEQFKSDFASAVVREKVNSDLARGAAAGVRGTPTFFLNGTAIQNPRSYDEFRSVVADALDAAQ
jgi:protein-disulfide isomerase